MYEKEKEKKVDKNINKDINEDNKNNLINLKDFEIEKELNSSNEYIKIYKVLRKIDNKHYILLKYPLTIINDNINDFEKLEKMLDTIKILLKNINHINVLNIKESFFENTKTSVIMILELYDNKTLYNNIIYKYKLMRERYIPEDELLDYLYNIIEGISILHKNNIFNINLSPHNIYIDDNNNIKLNPYISIENLSSEQCSNNNYFKIPAPELSKNNKNYTSKTDIWYLGLLIYELTQLNPLKKDYPDINDNIYNYIIKGKYYFNKYYSNDIKELLKLCLQYSKNRRPSADELLKLIDIDKKNKIIKSKLLSLNNSRKFYNFKRKIDLKQEINKINHTLAKIKNYDIKTKYKICRDLTPQITRKNSNLSIYNINIDKSNKLSKNTEFFNNKANKIFKRPKLQLKTCFIDNNKINFHKTGKKFFGINKNDETLNGYLKTKPYNMTNFITKYPTYFKYGRNQTTGSILKVEQKSLNLLNSNSENYIQKDSKYKKLNININYKSNDFKRLNSHNYNKRVKNNIYEEKRIFDKKMKQFSVFKSKSFYLPYWKNN